MPPPSPKQDEEDESWLATYADAITLLMAFFVMLVAVSKTDLALFEQVADGISQKVTKSERKSTFTELKEDTAEVVSELTDGKVLKVGVDDQGIILEFSSETFFHPGTANIVEAAYPVIQGVSELVNSPQYVVFNMDIEGHTDDDPINTVQFPSNWELGAARAASVLRLMAQFGTERTRMRVLSYAETVPKEPNRDEAGTPLPENKAINRRVVMRIHQQSLQPSKPRFIPLTSIARETEGGTPENSGAAGPDGQPDGQPAAPAPSAEPAPAPAQGTTEQTQ